MGKIIYHEHESNPEASMMEPVIEARFNELVEGRSKDPHRILGLHMDDDGAVIRAFNPSSRIIDIKNIFTG